jgi:integrase
VEEAKRKKRRHRRNEGSTYRVKDGGWMAALSLGTDRKTGKRRVVRRRAPDQPAAERALKRLQREWGQAGEVAFVRLDDYLDDWLAAIEPSIAPATLMSYRSHVDTHISPFLGHLTVGSLRPADAQRLANRIHAGGRSPSTVAHVISTLRMALSQAVRDGELTANVAQSVRLPRQAHDPVEALTLQRARDIRAAVKEHWLEPIVTLLLGTGMRLGEACALDWHDVDLAKARILIRHGKTRSATRTVHLVPFVVAALERQRVSTKRYGPNEPVFLGTRINRRTRTIERLSGQSVTHAFPDLLEAKGLPRMRVHDLRHGTATLLLAEGVPMRVISEILGHANPALTARLYAHVSDESARSAMASLENIETG